MNCGLEDLSHSLPSFNEGRTIAAVTTDVQSVPEVNLDASCRQQWKVGGEASSAGRLELLRSVVVARTGRGYV